MPRPAPAVPPQQGPYGGEPQNGARPYRPGSAVKAQSRPGEHDPRINLPPRSGTLQAMFLLWVGVTALVPVVEAVMGVPNYGATTAKAAMQLLGVLDDRHVRGPLVPLDDAEYSALEAALRSADLL